ncbi:MAG: hypothetical protein V2B18_17205, partial [Pseudomonadota bacterium]
PKGRSKPRFNVDHKDDFFLIEGRAIRQLRREIRETLGRYGFQPDLKPERKDGCAIALLYEELLSGNFLPALGNILLIGDAAGLILPITFEGIGSALKSGISAADSVLKAAETGKQAASFYLDRLEPILTAIRPLYSMQHEVDAASGEDPGAVAAAVLAAYRSTLTVQDI